MDPPLVGWQEGWEAICRELGCKHVESPASEQHSSRLPPPVDACTWHRAAVAVSIGACGQRRHLSNQRLESTKCRGADIGRRIPRVLMYRTLTGRCIELE